MKEHPKDEADRIGWFPMPAFSPRTQWIGDDSETLAAWTRLWASTKSWPSSARFRGRKVPLEVGQLATTYLGFADLCGWSRNRVKTFFSELIKSEELLVTPRSYDPESDTWKDSKSDSGLLVLTLLCHPFRKSESEIRTADRTAKRTGDEGKGQEKDRERTAEKDSGSDSEKDRGLDTTPILEAPKPDSEKDSGSDSKKDTSLKDPRGENRTRLNNNSKTLPPVPPSPGERGVRGDLERLLGGAGKEGGGDPPGHPADLRHPMLGFPNPRRALELMATIGLGRAIARPCSEQLPLGRVFDVVIAARGHPKPGGWARTAFVEGFEVPRANGEDLKRLVGLLEGDRANLARLYGEASSRPRDPALDRRPGESESDWLGRAMEHHRGRLGKASSSRKKEASP